MTNSSITFTVYINGVKLDDKNSAVYKIAIEETISGEFPRLDMSLGLRDIFLTSYPLTDGTPIVVEIYDDVIKGSFERYNFRLYSFEAMSSPSGGTLDYMIVAYHESLWKLSVLEDSAYSTTSAGLFKQIANKTDMTPDVDETNDYMTWFTVEGNRLNLLREVCLHSWANKYSVFAWWVNRFGELNFKNLIYRIQQKPSRKLIETTDLMTDLYPGATPITNVMYSMESAVNNFRYGYGNNISFFDVENISNRVQYPREFQVNAQSVNISSAGKNQSCINSGISSGNTHSNYQRAEIQNKRGLALWSTVISCVDQYCFNANLGDCVEFVFKVDGRDESLLYSGNYLISGIKFVVDSTNRPMKQLFLVRQGISVPALDETQNSELNNNG